MKITTLSEAQRARFSEFVQRWTDIGLCTTPADRPAAEAAIRQMYEKAGREHPQKIVWCGSPFSQGLTRHLVQELAAKAPGDSVRDSVWASVWDSVRDSVWASVRDSVWDSVWDSVGASVGASVRDSVRASVGASVRASVGASVWASVGASVGASVRDSVWDSVWDSVGASVWDSVRDSVWASVWDSVRDSVWASVGDSCYGQHDANWLAFYAFFREVCGLEEQTEKLAGLTALAQTAGWALPHANICWVSERPCVLQRDERGRLHSVNGPAVEYPDGWSIYAVHGVRVPGRLIMEPGSITAAEIEAEENAEIRRVMMDQLGWERYLRESGAKQLHRDDCGILWRKEVADDEPLVMVEVLNSTPEPDGTMSRDEAAERFAPGTPVCHDDMMIPLEQAPRGLRFKGYMLRVPPDMKTARAAAAWTFGLKEEEYQPAMQS
jgi:hypothetical protein